MTATAKPVQWPWVRDAPPTDEVASAGCPGMLDADLMLLMEVNLADDVIGGSTTVVDVTIPPSKSWFQNRCEGRSPLTS